MRTFILNVLPAGPIQTQQNVPQVTPHFANDVSKHREMLNIQVSKVQARHMWVTIGRRCIPTSTASSSDQVQVDVDLGPLKSVSRLHAKIEYEEEEERFMLLVLGRNGAWVDGMWSGKGSKVPLSERYAL